MFEFIKQNLINHLEQRKVICINCNGENTLKITPQKFTTWKCACGIQIFYPANSARDYGTTIFVSFVENLIFKKIKEEQLKINSFQDFNLLYETVLKDFNVLPESQRFYRQYKKRVGSKNARIFGKIRNP